MDSIFFKTDEAAPKACGAKHPKYPSVSCQINGGPHMGQHIGVVCVMQGGKLTQMYMPWWEPEILECLQRKVGQG